MLAEWVTLSPIEVIGPVRAATLKKKKNLRILFLLENWVVFQCDDKEFYVFIVSLLFFTF